MHDANYGLGTRLQYGAFEDEKSVCMVVEYAPGGDLMNKLMARKSQRMSENETKYVITQLLSALTYLHGLGIVHRDIKPENLIFAHDGVLKLLDFGVSIDVNRERPVSAVGTLEYMSPEATMCPLKSRPSENKNDEKLAYGIAADVWAVGILASDMVGGKTPFANHSSPGDIRNCILKGEINLPSTLSLGLVNFISLATALKPSDRPSAGELLHHEWLTGVGSKSRMANEVLQRKRLVPASTLPGQQHVAAEQRLPDQCYMMSMKTKHLIRGLSVEMPASPVSVLDGAAGLTSPTCESFSPLGISESSNGSPPCLTLGPRVSERLQLVSKAFMLPVPSADGNYQKSSISSNKTSISCTASVSSTTSAHETFQERWARASPKKPELPPIQFASGFSPDFFLRRLTIDDVDARVRCCLNVQSPLNKEISATYTGAVMRQQFQVNSTSQRI